MSDAATPAEQAEDMVNLESGAAADDEMQGESQESPLDRLPDEVMLQILKCLPVVDLVIRVPLTCHRLYRLARDPAVWRRQDLQYRGCDSDADFATAVKHAPYLFRLDLTGVMADSPAENCLENIKGEVARLVLSDEMDGGAAVRLVDRLLPGLESLHVGRLVMKKEHYSELMRLVDESSLRELKLAASIRLREFSDLHDFRPRPPEERHLQHLEVWSEDDMPVYAICRLIRAHQDSLRFVSHEYMSFKPPEPQERRIMDAVGQCKHLVGARVWSSKRLAVLADCENLRSLSLTCDGECRGDNQEMRACEELFLHSSTLPRLREMCLRFMECRSVNPQRCIAERCPDIEELTIQCVSLITGYYENFKAMKKLRRLTLIGVHYLHPDVFLKEWDDDMLPKLTLLNLIGAARFCPWVCWADHVKRLRALRPNLVILLKECEHFRDCARAASDS